MSFQVHKLVLACTSLTAYNILNCTADTGLTVPLSASALQCFVSYLYTGIIDNFTVEVVTELRLFAKSWDIIHLGDLCDSFLVSYTGSSHDKSFSVSEELSNNENEEDGNSFLVEKDNVSQKRLHEDDQMDIEENDNVLLDDNSDASSGETGGARSEFEENDSDARCGSNANSIKKSGEKASTLGRRKKKCWPALRKKKDGHGAVILVKNGPNNGLIFTPASPDGTPVPSTSDDVNYNEGWKTEGLRSYVTHLMAAICGICKQTFERHTPCVEHIVKAHKDSLSPSVKDQNGAQEQSFVIQCSYCSANCNSAHEIAIHIRLAHKRSGQRIKYVKKADLLMENVSDCTKQDNCECIKHKPFECSCCKKTFTTMRGCLSHLVQEHLADVYDQNVRNFVNDFFPYKENGVYDGKTPKEKFCAIDGCTFSHKIAREICFHQFWTHDVEVPDWVPLYVCHICGISKRCGGHFWQHMKLKHAEIYGPPDKSHLCDLCGAAFSEAKGLKRHMLTHSDASSHKQICPECGKVFPISGGLRKHMRTHMDYLPFGCKYCSYKSTQKANVRTHVRSQHRDKDVHTGVTVDERWNSVKHKTFQPRDTVDLKRDKETESALPAPQSRNEHTLADYTQQASQQQATLAPHNIFSKDFSNPSNFVQYPMHYVLGYENKDETY